MLCEAQAVRAYLQITGAVDGQARSSWQRLPAGQYLLTCAYDASVIGVVEERTKGTWKRREIVEGEGFSTTVTLYAPADLRVVITGTATGTAKLVEV